MLLLPQRPAPQCLRSSKMKGTGSPWVCKHVRLRGSAARPCAMLPDVVALGNLCVDVVVPVSSDSDFPSDLASKRQLLARLTAAPQDTSSWEVGGNCNFMLAASRLGLKVGSVGHLGSDSYGQWMEGILQNERIVDVQRIAPEHLPPPSSSPATPPSPPHSPPTHSKPTAELSQTTPMQPPADPLVSPEATELNQTLVCFVLVDPHSRHAFCSRYDLGPWPLLQGLKEVPSGAAELLRGTKAVFCNGFVFDECDLSLVTRACDLAHRNGATIFFDPGPRCFTMASGERQKALHAVLDVADVILMTEEEAVTVTGCSDPEEAAKAILARPSGRTQWCVVKMGGAGALLRVRGQNVTHFSPGMKVDVQDTVGCGDSFAAAIVLGFIQKYTVGGTLALANAVGAATAMGRGAGRNVAQASQVMDLLRKAKGSGMYDQAAILEAIGILEASREMAASR